MTKPIVLTEEEAQAIAQGLTDALFALGSDPGHAVGRIQFMAGTWPDESPRGGMCRQALVTFFKGNLLARSGGEEQTK